MFPNIGAQKKLTVEEMQRLQTDNSSKMVQILSTLAKSNEEMARKTDLLLKTTLDMVGASKDINRCSEEATKQATQAVRYIKRIGKKMLEIVPHQGQLKPDNRANPSHSIHQDDQPLQSQPLNAISTSQTVVDPKKTLRNGGQTSQLETHANGFSDGRVMDRLLIMEKKMSEMVRSIEQIKEGDNENLRISFSKVEEVLESAIRQVEIGEAKEIDKKLIYLQISTWVGDLFRHVSDLSYRKYVKHEVSQSQARLMFCQTVILNLLDFMDYMRRTDSAFWIRNRFEILDLCSDSARNILKFLKSKYPRNAKNFKSIEFESLVEKVNNSQDPRYDILKNIGIELPPKGKIEDKTEVHYIREIKTLFNRLIEEVDKEYQNYHTEMVKIFTGGQKELEGKGKYLIGKKFKDNTPPFEEDEMNTLDFKCKSPEILRILIKWLEEIEDMVNDTEKQIMKKMAFKDIKLKASQAFPASEPLRRAMVEHLNRKRDLNKNDKKAEHEILIDLFDNICELVSEKPKGVEFLNIDDVKAIKFSQLLSSCLPFLTISRIEFITRIFRTFQQEKNPKYGLLESLDLLTFSVFDLLRSKCSGTKNEIMEIYKRLKDSKYMTQIRVKNRLDTPMNDILINCKINKSPIVCEVQLIITNEFLTEKSNINDHFNHFLYELERSRFGPFSEACLIISASDPRMSYAGELKKIKMKMNRLTKEEMNKLVLVAPNPADRKCHVGHTLTELDFKLPFICCICSSFNSEYASSFNGLQCSACSLKICPSCIMDNIKQGNDRQNIYMEKVKLDKDLFEKDFYELRKMDPNGKDTLENVIKKILLNSGHEFAMLLRFSQGTIQKRGFKLLRNSKMLCPVYFLMKEDIPELGKVENYDVLLIVKSNELKTMSVKDIKKRKNLEFMTDDVTLSKLEGKATELQKCFVCRESSDTGAGARLLVIDYENVEKDFESAMEKMRLLSLVNECATTNNTTLEMSSRGLEDLSFLQRKTDILKHVLTIVADSNKLKNIDKFLQNFPNLKKLSLKENELSSYKMFDLTNNDNFLDLFLAKNLFKELPVVKAKNVTRVSFKHNKLEDISSLALYQMPSLNEFGAAENKIKVVPQFNLPALQKLILKSNKIESMNFLTKSVCPKLKKLEFDDNLVSEIPVLNFNSLKEIVLSKNKITSLGWFNAGTLPNVETLEISGNAITQIPENNTANIKKLDISDNQVGSLSTFKYNKWPKLKEFIANTNKIVDIPFMILPNLVKIDVTNNQISRFEYEKEAEAEEERNFIDSELRALTWMGIVKDNKFHARAIVMMELERVFEYVKHIE